MKITKELLERYELGQCTDQEQAFVSDWLANDLLDEVEFNTDDVDVVEETHVKQAIWSDIASHIDQKNPSEKVVPAKKSKTLLLWGNPWMQSAAASLLFMGIAWFVYQSPSDVDYRSFSANNIHQKVMQWQEEKFDVSLSKNSSASIDFRSGNMAISGDILFTPKKNLILYDASNRAPIDFKEGEIYYISTDPDTSELMVFAKSDMEYLPPIIQKHIRKQFQSI